MGFNCCEFTQYKKDSKKIERESVESKLRGVGNMIAPRRSYERDFDGERFREWIEWHNRDNLNDDEQVMKKYQNRVFSFAREGGEMSKFGAKVEEGWIGDLLKSD